jgi:hypothetical protein
MDMRPLGPGHNGNLFTLGEIRIPASFNKLIEEEDSCRKSHIFSGDSTKTMSNQFVPMLSNHIVLASMNNALESRNGHQKATKQKYDDSSITMQRFT